jgi:N6-L-threonylcarbamoyladenine synthase
VLCLGIETSCDETALALVRDGCLLGQSLRSQVDVHALFGGVVPELASREHGRCIGPLYDHLLKSCGVEARDVDCLAVARGPGLLGSLLVGIAFAKGLALALQKPLLGVNHLHAHLLAAGLESKLAFPALGLLVSGGHTHIYRIESPRDFTLLGRSLDDAAGEAIDKFGKMLGLPYPAGKFIDEFAVGGEVDTKMFPKPYLDNDNCDFSFSGLKTAARTLLDSRPHLRFVYDAERLCPVPAESGAEFRQELALLCASFLYAVAQTLRLKLERALRTKWTGPINSILLAGGVAANRVVRQNLSDLAAIAGLPLVVPSPALCTDNAAMIAYAGQLLREQGLRHDLSFAAIPRGQQVPDDYWQDLGYIAPTF